MCRTTMQNYKQAFTSQVLQILGCLYCFQFVFAQDWNTRLSGGLSPHEGRVEIYYEENWNTICDDQWDIRDASVVCRQLGYVDAEVAFGEAFFGTGTGRIIFDEVRCEGDESTLFDCPSDGIFNHNCDHTEDAGVRCLYNDTFVGDVRLSGGSSAHEGRVEIYFQNEWGTVCDTHWDTWDARVICRQLGYNGVYRVHGGAYFGEGSGPIMSQIDCDGDESFWLHCSPEGWNTTACNHSNDSGVTCSYLEPFPTPRDGNVRLADGLSNNLGRVEIYYQGDWGTVCGKKWTYEDAGVICRQLGFPGVYSFSRGPPYAEGSGPIMGQLGCRGNEWFWQDCPFTDWDTLYCGHTEDATLICSLTGGAHREGNVRLNGADSEYSGRVEIFHDNEWGTICDNGWSIVEANVICNQLGFPGAISYQGGAYYGRGTGSVMLDDVECNGLEQQLTECKHSGWFNHDCTHDQDVGVHCRVPGTYFPRLVDGDQWNEGRVEVWDGTRWERFCASNFYEDEASIVCQQTGFLDYDLILPNDQFGVGFAPASDVGFYCSSNDKSLSTCYIFPIKGTSYCGSVAVRCDVAIGAPNQLSAGVIALIVVGSMCALVVIVAFFIVVVVGPPNRRGQISEHAAAADDVTNETDCMGPKPIDEHPAPPSYSDAISDPPDYFQSSTVVSIASAENPSSAATFIKSDVQSGSTDANL